MERMFDSKPSWTDAVRATHRAIWTGEHDAEIAKMASVLPPTLDNQPAAMQKRLAELFTPFRPLLHSQRAEAQQMVNESQKKAELDKQEKERMEREGAAKTVGDDNELRTIAGVTMDGDVTDDLFFAVRCCVQEKVMRAAEQGR